MTDSLRFYKDPFGDTRWRVEAPNGEPTLASTEGYVKASDALANAQRYLQLSPTEDPNVLTVHTTEDAAPTGLVTESVETLAGVLGKHEVQDGRFFGCTCGGWRNDSDYTHAEHVRDALIASGAVRPAAEVRAEALREFADWWDDPANVEELREIAHHHYRAGGPAMPAIVARIRAALAEEGGD